MKSVNEAFRWMPLSSRPKYQAFWQFCLGLFVTHIPFQLTFVTHFTSSMQNNISGTIEKKTPWLTHPADNIFFFSWKLSMIITEATTIYSYEAIATYWLINNAKPLSMLSYDRISVYRISSAVIYIRLYVRRSLNGEKCCSEQVNWLYQIKCIFKISQWKATVNLHRVSWLMCQRGVDTDRDV